MHRRRVVHKELSRRRQHSNISRQACPGLEEPAKRARLEEEQVDVALGEEGFKGLLKKLFAQKLIVVEIVFFFSEILICKFWFSCGLISNILV